jgi:hypothetical protein
MFGLSKEMIVILGGATSVLVAIGLIVYAMVRRKHRRQAAIMSGSTGFADDNVNVDATL